jgi:uncharacterized cupredoxin-like copper-binding protein
MRWLAALPLLGALTLAGCGGGPSYTHVRDGVLKVDLDEYTLRPENVEVPAGTIHLVAHNSGRLTHNLTIEAWDREEGEEATVYGRTDTLQPGQTAHERAPIVLKPGKYRLVCTIGNHDDLGQYGELKVVAK